ncbi:MAG: PaaI family thioesterase [Solirubrobacterales bacterium]|nr:PaaI family thioesterase [Solirubrobacterales bacterium]
MPERPWDHTGLPVPLIPLEQTFEGFLGLEWIELTSDSAHVRFEVRENLKQPLGLLHGGIYCAVAETVASVATVREVWRDGFVGMGMSNSASFLRPVTAGTVDVIAALRARGDREWLWTHDFRDEAGRLCALVNVTIAVRPRSDRAGDKPSAKMVRRPA